MGKKLKEGRHRIEQATQTIIPDPLETEIEMLNQQVQVQVQERRKLGKELKIVSSRIGRMEEETELAQEKARQHLKRE